MKHNFAHELSPVEELEKRALAGQWWDSDSWDCFRLPLIAEEEAEETYYSMLVAEAGYIGLERARSMPDPEDETAYEAAMDEAFGELLERADESTREILEDLYEDRLEEWKKDFIAGWKEAGGLTADLEDGAPEPWCCPWLWKADWDWDRETRCGSARKAGELWWAEVGDEVERLAEEESLDREAEEEE